MADAKDPLGDKLRQKEKAEEDQYFSKRDQALLEQKRQARLEALEREVREGARGRCPKCGERLGELNDHGVTVEECPSCKGVWFDPGEVELLARRERDSWIGRFFYRPRR